MKTNNIQITLRGSTIQDVVAQARAFVLSAGGEVTTAAIHQDAPAPKTKAPRKRAATNIEPLETKTTAETLNDDDGQMGLMAFDGGDETEVVEEPKKTKPKKVTSEDVNAAAMAHAKVNGRAQTLAILTKKFKVKSVLELKADQFESVLKALEV